MTYTFDGNFERVMDDSPKLYWYGIDGSVLAQTDGSGNPVNEYIYFDGMRIARRDASGNVYYSFGNELGSPTVTTAAGSLCYDADFFPFGGERAYTSTCAPNHKFAGMEQDSSTGLYRTIFRQYAANNGRWLSPDPYRGSYDPSNPQSMNRYAYVGNMPMNYIDPTDLDWYCMPQSLEGGGWIWNCVWIEPMTTTVKVTANSDGCSATNQSACAPAQPGNGPYGPSNGGYGGSGGYGGGGGGGGSNNGVPPIVQIAFHESLDWIQHHAAELEGAAWKFDQQVTACTDQLTLDNAQTLGEVNTNQHIVVESSSNFGNCMINVIDSL
ncbi:MAG TPA: RHS repeat-associated core domain-containing protein [Terracidiphilus sp.]|nr:RHS repeat-associated core domain-containing protein [Terracidiphilus sp.]